MAGDSLVERLLDDAHMIQRDGLGATLATAKEAAVRIAALEAEVACKDALLVKIAEMVRLFPEAYDTLTRQEMRDAKGNYRSLFHQQSNALSELRTALERPTHD